jgi:hypothetical protein
MVYFIIMFLNFGNSWLNYTYSLNYFKKSKKLSSKVLCKNISQEKKKHVSNLCSSPKISRKINMIVTFLNFFLNYVMISNIKIKNIKSISLKFQNQYNMVNLLSKPF